jgi:hypothetical protein
MPAPQLTAILSLLKGFRLLEPLDLLDTLLSPLDCNILRSFLG